MKSWKSWLRVGHSRSCNLAAQAFSKKKKYKNNTICFSKKYFANKKCYANAHTQIRKHCTCTQFYGAWTITANPSSSSLNSTGDHLHKLWCYHTIWQECRTFNLEFILSLWLLQSLRAYHLPRYYHVQPWKDKTQFFAGHTYGHLFQ